MFPLDTLSVNHALAGLVTEVFALAIFLCFLVAFEAMSRFGGMVAGVVDPADSFYAGVCWFLAALGVFVRDLAQVIGFILTLWFFITPICYPEQSVPASAMAILSKNPMFVLVRAYRAIFLGSRSGLISAAGLLGNRDRGLSLRTCVVLQAAQNVRGCDLILSTPRVRIASCSRAIRKRNSAPPE